jgi:hypothetical protein
VIFLLIRSLPEQQPTLPLERTVNGSAAIDNVL